MVERDPQAAITVPIPWRLPRLPLGVVAAGSWRLARREPLTFLSLTIMVAVVVMAVLAPWIATHDPLAADLRARLEGPSANHFFGTDAIGRDVFSRVVYGARVSLLVGFATTLAATVLGTLVGIISGYLGGVVDQALQRFMDGIQAIPALVFLMLVAAIWQQGMVRVVVVLAVLIAPYVGRLVRGIVLSLREEQFVLAARTMGAGPLRIMLVHSLPNVIAPVIVVKTWVFNVGR